MTIKASFKNVANVLLDWDDFHNADYCSWKGILCGDNVSSAVVSLYVFLLASRRVNIIYGLFRILD